MFPELALTGYPPEDLLLKPGFIADNLEALGKVAAASERCAAVVGFVDERTDLYNAAAVCAFGQVQGVYHKQMLPNYGVFDEKRYFAAGTGATQLFLIGGVRVGVSVCEDAWSPLGPIAEQAAAGAELVVNINASPYYAGRLVERKRMLATRAADASCTLVYVNLVGGQDELVFDGASLVFDPDGNVRAALPQFEENVTLLDLDIRSVFRKRLLDPRGHRTAPPLPVTPIVAEPRRVLDDRLAAPPMPPALGAHRGDLPGAGARDPRLRDQERVLRRGHRPLRRHRLVACRRRRRPTRSGPNTSTASPCRRAIRVITREATPRSWPSASASISAPSPSKRPTRRSSRCWHRRSPGWPRI